MITWATRNTKNEEDARGNGTGNNRNGKTSKRIRSEQGELEIEAPVIATDRSNPRSSRSGSRALTALNHLTMLFGNRRAIGDESCLSGDAVGLKEMDDADTKLEASVESVHYRIW